jgi:hypothetical protein
VGGGGERGGVGFINSKMNQSWRGKYFQSIWKEKIIGNEKLAYPFQREGGEKGQNKMSTFKSYVELILNYC